jgi:hypothetical protein
LIAAPIATASNFGSGIDHACDTTYASQCVADNYDHKVQFFSMDNANLLASSRDRMGYYNSFAGRLNMHEVSSSADVNVQDLYVGAVGWWGVGYCATSATYGGSDPNRWCRPQVLTYNLSYSQGVGQPYYLACHELGHTVGLRHYNNDTCMVNADLTGLSIITSHERDHINARYGN